MSKQLSTVERASRADGRAAAYQAALERRHGRELERARIARNNRVRRLGFGVTAVAVLAIGGVLAFGDFFDRPVGKAGEIDVQSSMAGFSPGTIHVVAGSTVTLNWWTQDAAMHLEGGVHTMIAPDLGLYETLPAESSRTISWTVPDRPGTYDVYCDTCCGGKDSPTMHGRIVIELVSASRPGTPVA
jgi:cytochrome c oxidase subunit 2